MSRTFYRLQMKAGKTGPTIAKEVLAENRITAHIDYAFERFEKLDPGSIVIVHKSSDPIAIVKVIKRISESEIDLDLSLGIDHEVEVLSYYDDALKHFPELIELRRSIPFPGTFNKVEVGNPTYKKINNWYNLIMDRKKQQDYLNLLRFKKQIILQGPPGTGKTKLAKQLARELTLPETIVVEDIKRLIKTGLLIKSKSDKKVYEVISVDSKSVTLRKDNDTIETRNFTQIIEAYSKLSSGKGTEGGDTYQFAIASYIRSNWNDEKTCKIIQFHPSYSYEDFVRGIVAESKGDKIEYTNTNKILGAFAKTALENYELSTGKSLDVQIDLWTEDSFNDFKEEIDINTQQGETKLSGDIGIFKVDNNCFRYGREWKTTSRINFNDFKKLIKAVINNELNLDQNTITKELSVHAHHRFTYYLALLRLFFNKYQFTQTSQKAIGQNYVLIIDEINRANLSSVFGELIYALEYRGDKVESMYKVNDNAELILPPNLYIIGTMNTADRSVGNIDYAIRRRFAFVNVLPEDLSDEPGIVFSKALYDQVATLFDKNTSSEFDKKDVQLGHSYFIDKTEEGGSMAIRLQYEIKPILMEYVKDGILIGENIKSLIDSLTV